VARAQGDPHSSNPWSGSGQHRRRHPIRKAGGSPRTRTPPLDCSRAHHAPVCPYASTEALKPDSSESSAGLPILSNTCCWLESTSKAASKGHFSGPLTKPESLYRRWPGSTSLGYMMMFPVPSTTFTQRERATSSGVASGSARAARLRSELLRGRRRHATVMPFASLTCRPSARDRISDAAEGAGVVAPAPECAPKLLSSASRPLVAAAAAAAAAMLGAGVLARALARGVAGAASVVDAAVAGRSAELDLREFRDVMGVPAAGVEERPAVAIPVAGGGRGTLGRGDVKDGLPSAPDRGLPNPGAGVFPGRLIFRQVRSHCSKTHLPTEARTEQGKNTKRRFVGTRARCAGVHWRGATSSQQPRRS
jgi:hypothetical protein